MSDYASPDIGMQMSAARYAQGAKPGTFNADRKSVV